MAAGEDAGTIYAEVMLKIDKLTGQVKSANEKIASIGKTAADSSQKASGGFGDLGSSITKVIPGIGLLATGFAAVTKAVQAGIQFVKESIKVYQEYAQVSARVDAVLRSTGAAAWTTTGQLQETANALGTMSGQTETDIVRMQSVLLGFRSITGNVFNDTQQAIIDMTAVMGGDLASAANTMGKALDDPVTGMTALNRMGFAFGETEKKLAQQFEDAGNHAAAQRVVLDEVMKTYNGAAAASNNATLGASKLSSAMEDLKRGLGEGFSPALNKVQTFFAGIVQAAADSVQKTLDVNRALEALNKNIKDMELSNQIDTMKDKLAGLNIYLEAIEKVDPSKIWNIRGAMAGNLRSAIGGEAGRQAALDFMDEYDAILESKGGNVTATYEALLKKYKDLSIRTGSELAASLNKQTAQAAAIAGAGGTGGDPDGDPGANTTTQEKGIDRIKQLQDQYNISLRQSAEYQKDTVNISLAGMKDIKSARESEINGLIAYIYELEDLKESGEEYNAADLSEAKKRLALHNRNLATLNEQIAAEERRLEIAEKNKAASDQALEIERQYAITKDAINAAVAAGEMLEAEATIARQEAADKQAEALRNLAAELQHTDDIEGATIAAVLEKAAAADIAADATEDEAKAVRDLINANERMTSSTESLNEQADELVLTKQLQDKLAKSSMTDAEKAIEIEYQLERARILAAGAGAEETEAALAALNRLRQAKVDLLEDEEKTSEKPLLEQIFGGEDTIGAIANMAQMGVELLGSIANLATAIINKQKEEQLAAAQEAYDAKKELLDKETNDKLYAAGLIKASTTEQYEQELEKARATGDEVLIYQAEQALEKSLIEEEAAAEDERIKKEFENKKAQIEYNAALESWKMQMAMGAASMAQAMLNALTAQPAPWATAAALTLAASTGIVNLAALDAAKPKPPTPFAGGGIVQSPTPFMFASGAAMQQGIMGEAGPEAIMPLSRGADGALGVNASGVGMNATIITVLDGKVLAKSTVALINNGIYTIEARGVR
jgi:hypothetical protein